jgi:ATP-binding cassette subfamily B protein
MRRWLNALKRNINSDDVALVRRIVAENAPRHWRGYTLAFLMTAIVAACTSITAYLIGSVVNATYKDRSFSAVTALALAMIALFAIRGVATFGHAVAVARVGNRITAETQRRIFSKLLRQGIPYFADRRSSEVMANMMLGASAIGGLLNQLVLSLGRDLLSLIFLIGVMIWQDPILSMICLAVLPVALVGVQKLVLRARRIADTQFSGSTELLGTMQETLQGIKVVKAFSLEGRVRDRVEDNVRALENASNKLARVSNRSAPLIEALGGVAIGMACLYSGYRVLETNAAPGEFVSFMTAFLLAFEPARRLGRLRVDINGFLATSASLYRMLDAPTSEEDDADKPALQVSTGRVELHGVAFSYQAGVPVLQGLSLVAEPGRLTALVGPSGGGKTTVFNLLLGFYETDGGKIMIDGQDLKAVSRCSLRSQISYVGQDIYLFQDTVRSNILMGKLAASDAEVIEAAKAAHAHDFIMKMPLGYDTPVGEGGSQLSLGQRQRIALARAFIRNTPVVLLDEPTASLDSESEHAVQAAIRRLCQGKTTLAIAHRLNTILDADRIHVIEGGRIVEAGKHDELITLDGRYATFFQLQFARQLQQLVAVEGQAVADRSEPGR